MDDGPVWGDSDPQWLLAAQQFPPGCMASSLPGSLSPGSPSQDKQVSRPLELHSGDVWFWRGCSPCSKGIDMSQDRSRCWEPAMVGVTWGKREMNVG